MLSALGGAAVYQSSDRWALGDTHFRPGWGCQDVVSRGCGSRAWWLSQRPATSGPGAGPGSGRASVYWCPAVNAARALVLEPSGRTELPGPEVMPSTDPAAGGARPRCAGGKVASSSCRYLGG
jgi:hypothetical protein